MHIDSWDLHTPLESTVDTQINKDLPKTSNPVGKQTREWLSKTRCTVLECSSLFPTSSFLYIWFYLTSVSFASVVRIWDECKESLFADDNSFSENIEHTIRGLGCLERLECTRAGVGLTCLWILRQDRTWSAFPSKWMNDEWKDNWP